MVVTVGSFVVGCIILKEHAAYMYIEEEID
jgi:hypothetical protein